MIRWLERWALKRADRREGESLIELKEMLAKVEDGRMTAEAAFGGPAVQIFMAAAVEWFKKSGGDNYVTCEVTCKKTLQRYTLTMQRCNGKTPAQELCELRSQVTQLKGAA